MVSSKINRKNKGGSKKKMPIFPSTMSPSPIDSPVLDERETIFRFSNKKKKKNIPQWKWEKVFPFAPWWLCLSINVCTCPSASVRLVRQSSTERASHFPLTMLDNSCAAAPFVRRGPIQTVKSGRNTDYIVTSSLGWKHA